MNNLLLLLIYNTSNEFWSKNSPPGVFLELSGTFVLFYFVQCKVGFNTVIVLVLKSGSNNLILLKVPFHANAQMSRYFL